MMLCRSECLTVFKTMANIPKSIQGAIGRLITFVGSIEISQYLRIPVSNTTPDFDNLEKKGLVRVNSETDAFEYHNGTEWIASSGVNQNNIPRVLKVYYENNQNGIVINQVLKAINEEGFFENVNFTIDDFETYIISAYPIFNPAIVGWIPPVYKYKVVNIGKSNVYKYKGTSSSLSQKITHDFSLSLHSCSSVTVPILIVLVILAIIKSLCKIPLSLISRNLFPKRFLALPSSG